MGDPTESVVRRFLSASVDPTVEELVGFFSDDAVWIDGPRGVHRGIDAIRTELELQLSMGFKMVSIQVKSLVANDGLVMMERVDAFTVGGKPFSIEVMAAFKTDGEGRTELWRDSFDLKTIVDQMEAAGFAPPA